MTRIVYVIFSGGGVQGGQKMILRHVETLRELGFDAVAYTTSRNTMPTWFEHHAPIQVDAELRPDDIVVAPDDAMITLRQLTTLRQRAVVMVQGHINFAADSLPAIDAFPPAKFPVFLTVSHTVAAAVRRLYPQAEVGMARAFADERVFRPGSERSEAVAMIPRKRPHEAAAIANMFLKVRPAHKDIRWRLIEKRPEAEVAAILGASSHFVSLSRLEGLGMTPLEAMACGALVVGFPGLGGRDFATADNGFWVPDDDCEAAADALYEAVEVYHAGGPELARRREAGYETARQWSHAAFSRELEEFWMRHAPGARLKHGPLD